MKPVFLPFDGVVGIPPHDAEGILPRVDWLHHRVRVIPRTISAFSTRPAPSIVPYQCGAVLLRLVGTLVHVIGQALQFGLADVRLYRSHEGISLIE